MSNNHATMRWDPYLLKRDGAFDAFWSKRLAGKTRRILLVMGRGFDARTLEVARRLHGLGAKLEVLQLVFESPLAESAVRSEMTSRHHGGLVAMFGAGAIHPVTVALGGVGGGTSRNTKRALDTIGEDRVFDDVIVDISAMPRMVAMTAVAVLLKRYDDLASTADGRDVDLHVAVAESVSVDVAASRGSLSEGVTQVLGFSGQLEAQTTQNWPRVWFPVMGEGQRERLTLIKDFVNPDEIAPVIPFPTMAPRRGDEIVAEHRDVLFDDFQVEPANITLASEYNPFEAYKQIFAAMDRYRRALATLGGCKAFVSPLSSKLLSIGVLLACYDHKFGDVPDQRLDVGIPYVETAMYADPASALGVEVSVCSMWIRGEWEVVG